MPQAQNTDLKELVVQLKGMMEQGPSISRDALGFLSLPSSGKKVLYVAHSGAPVLKRQTSLRTAAVLSLPELMQNAVLVESGPNTKLGKKPNVLNYHRFYVPVEANGKTAIVRIVAEEVLDSDNLSPVDVDVYDVVIENGASPSIASPSARVTGQENSIHEMTIGDMLKNVKCMDGKFYEQAKSAYYNTGTFDGEQSNIFFQSADSAREGMTRKPDDAQMEVVHLKDVPELIGKKVKEILSWAKSILQSGSDVTIRSTGQVASFTTTNIKASLKRTRDEMHNEAYAALREMVERAEYSHSEKADVKHALRTDGQDVYTSALEIAGKLYSVRLKLDIVPEAIKAQVAKETPEDVRYKDHRLAEIEIAPALYQGSFKDELPLQDASAISYIGLGVLRGNVKPSELTGGALAQGARYEEKRGQIAFMSDGTAVVSLFEKADRSTFFHEMGHFMLEELIQYGLDDAATEDMKRDLAVAVDYLGIGFLDLSQRPVFLW